MCQTCAEYRPWDVICPYKSPEDQTGGDGGDISSELPVYTYDQIADQLTTGFWGGNTYSFNTGSDGALTVDLAGLTQEGQEMARLALDAWSEVTGITFTEAVTTGPSGTVTEAADGGAGTSATYAMSVGQDFDGTLGSIGDRDSVAITLSAGDRITISLSGDESGGNAAGDVALSLLNASGVVLQTSDDPYGTDGMIAFEVTTSGTYYIEAAGAGDAVTGDYTLSVRDIRSSSEITFDDASSGAFAQFWTSGSTITRARINIDDNWAGGQSRIDGYFYQTYLHEIGHALGLGHAGNYNGSARYPTDALYANDSWQASVMSYFYQTENSFIDANFAYAITPQMADLIAVHDLYGAPEARTGDDVYGTGGTTGTYLDAATDMSNPVSYTVYDTGGVDTFDFSHHGGDQLMDLREETFSNLDGLTGNIGIARGTTIEYGRTGGGNDVLIGNGADNGLTSGAGADTLDGGAGNDALDAGAGLDLVSGGDGFDLITGGDGADVLDGGDDGDLLFGEGVTLEELIELFPSWTPPAEAADLMAEGDLLAIWEDIVADVFAIA